MLPSYFATAEVTASAALLAPFLAASAASPAALTAVSVASVVALLAASAVSLVVLDASAAIFFDASLASFGVPDAASCGQRTRSGCIEVLAVPFVLFLAACVVVGQLCCWWVLLVLVFVVLGVGRAVCVLGTGGAVRVLMLFMLFALLLAVGAWLGRCGVVRVVLVLVMSLWCCACFRVLVCRFSINVPF